MPLDKNFVNVSEQHKDNREDQNEIDVPQSEEQHSVGHQIGGKIFTFLDEVVDEREND